MCHFTGWNNNITIQCYGVLWVTAEFHTVFGPHVFYIRKYQPKYYKNYTFIAQESRKSLKFIVTAWPGYKAAI